MRKSWHCPFNIYTKVKMGDLLIPGTITNYIWFVRESTADFAAVFDVADISEL